MDAIVELKDGEPTLTPVAVAEQEPACLVVSADPVSDQPLTADPISGGEADQAFTEGITNIRRLIADPETPVFEISRYIALQIANVVMRNNLIDGPRCPPIPRAEMGRQVRALRELQKTLSESEILSKGEVLNLDGPKFKYVFLRLLAYFEMALNEARVPKDVSRSIMLKFGDLVVSNQDSLRRDLKDI